MLCVWLPLLHVVLGNGPMPTSSAASAPAASFITLFSSLSRLRLPGTMESFERRADGEASGAAAVKPLARSSVSLSPLKRGEGRILHGAAGWSHFLGGPGIGHVNSDTHKKLKSDLNSKKAVQMTT